MVMSTLILQTVCFERGHLSNHVIIVQLIITTVKIPKILLICEVGLASDRHAILSRTFQCTNADRSAGTGSDQDKRQNPRSHQLRLIYLRPSTAQFHLFHIQDVKQHSFTSASSARRVEASSLQTATYHKRADLLQQVLIEKSLLLVSSHSAKKQQKDIIRVYYSHAKRSIISSQPNASSKTTISDSTMSRT